MIAAKPQPFQSCIRFEALANETNALFVHFSGHGMRGQAKTGQRSIDFESVAHVDVGLAAYEIGRKYQGLQGGVCIQCAA